MLGNRATSCGRPAGAACACWRCTWTGLVGSADPACSGARPFRRRAPGPSRTGRGLPGSSSPRWPREDEPGEGSHNRSETVQAWRAAGATCPGRRCKEHPLARARGWTGRGGAVPGCLSAGPGSQATGLSRCQMAPTKPGKLAGACGNRTHRERDLPAPHAVLKTGKTTRPHPPPCCARVPGRFRPHPQSPEPPRKRQPRTTPPNVSQARIATNNVR